MENQESGSLCVLNMSDLDYRTLIIQDLYIFSNKIFPVEFFSIFTNTIPLNKNTVYLHTSNFIIIKLCPLTVNYAQV